MAAYDDKALFAAVVMPYLGEAYALARWMTGTRPTPKTSFKKPA